MPHTPKSINGNQGSIKVGTTGTIGSLMSWELESMKHAPQASSSSQKKPQMPPVSVPCGSTSKKLQQRRNLFTESGTSNSSSTNGHTHCRTQKNHTIRDTILRKNGSEVPMLGCDDVTIDRNSNNKRADKKGHAYTVEVVDLKCNNPMSSRLKKLGFSKLSESTI